MRQFYELLKQDKKYVIGLMSGTSADGIDAALVEIEGVGLATRAALIAFETVPFPDGMRDRILACCQPDTGTVDAICELNFELGHLFASAVKGLLQHTGIPASAIALIGSHGQTIQHLPPRSTLQIGEPAVIAHETGIPTIADFRVADMAAGGQGAPLIAYPDYLLFRSRTETIGLLNIGGIANLTVLPANCVLEDVRASDTGPGNMVIDAVIAKITGGTQPYDTAGTLAASGTISTPLLDAWLRHSFFSKVPPKTTGREMFGVAFASECVADCQAHGLDDAGTVATVTELTVQSIVEYLGRFVPEKLDKLYISGGGAQNLTLMKGLTTALPDSTVAPVDCTGVPADAKEAIAFAILANETLHGEAGNVPTATGASVRKILGKWVFP